MKNKLAEVNGTQDFFNVILSDNKHLIAIIAIYVEMYKSVGVYLFSISITTALVDFSEVFKYYWNIVYAYISSE